MNISCHIKKHAHVTFQVLHKENVYIYLQRDIIFMVVKGTVHPKMKFTLAQMVCFFIVLNAKGDILKKDENL